MTPGDFDALFDSFTSTAFRLETRPSYRVSGAEAERIAARREGRPRPERSVRTQPWMARIATSTIHDRKSWRRVRVVDDPLTDYQRDQLESYKELQAVGEQIRITGRTDRVAGTPDFWLFDGGTATAHAVLMGYDDDGSVSAREPIPVGSPELGDLHVLAELLLAESVSLNEFLVDRSATASHD